MSTDSGMIAAWIAAVAAIAAPVITQLISQHGIYKSKTIELFFNAKADVYRNYVKITAQFPPFPSSEDLLRLNDCLNQAILYSSKDTSQKLALYVKFLQDQESDMEALAEAHLNAMLAMQAELKKYHY